MAAKREEFDIKDFSSFLEFFEHYVCLLVSKTLPNKCVRKEVLHDSIFADLRPNLCTFGALSKISKSKFKMSPTSGDLIVKMLGKKLDAQQMVVLQDEICQNSILKQYVTSGNIDQYNNIHLYLDRKTFINNVFKMVITTGSNYGQKICEPNNLGKELLVNCGNALAECGSTKDGFTAQQLRTILLCNHLVEILKQNRCSLQICDSGILNLLQKKGMDLLENNILRDFGVFNFDAQENHLSPLKLEEAQNILMSNLLKSKYRTEDSESNVKHSHVDCGELLMNKSSESGNVDHSASAVTQEDSTGNLELTKTSSSSLPLSGEVHLTDIVSAMVMTNCQNIKLNLFKFIEDLKKHDHGKGDYSGSYMYDKNLREVHVLSLWSDILYLEMLAEKTRMPIGKDEQRRIIHICGQEKQFYSQQIAVTWRLLTDSTLAERQMFLCHGPVVCSDGKVHNNDNASARNLLRVRTKQVRHSYLMKYGPIVNDESWTTPISKMAISVIKLEILLAPLKSQVKLDVTDSNECPRSCRQALFVLYNCARLAKIMEHFNSAVEKEVYPPLPNIDDVDFTYLKDEAEWNLIMKYVVSYPDVVANVGRGLEDASMVVKFNSNKIAQFLVSLCQDISAYYSRVHILGEPRSHLFPVMFARLYLVKVLHQVIQNALRLLSIESIDQM